MVVADYKFKKVKLCFLGVHNTVKNLSDANSIKDEFKFLIDPAKYQEQYLKRKKGNDTNKFDLTPLSGRNFSLPAIASTLAEQQNAEPFDFARNVFWFRYKGIHFSNGTPDYWKLQMPFIREPNNISVVLRENQLKLKVNIRPRVYISSIGWSSTVSIMLTGEMSHDQLIQIIYKIKNDPDPFLINGKPGSLSNLLRLASSNIFNQNYLPIDTVTKNNYCFTAVFEFSRTDFRYKGYRLMDNQDRADLLSILRGEKVDMEEWKNSINSEKVIPSFSDKYWDFELVDFEKGTLFFFDPKSKDESRPACHVANIQHLYMLFLMLKGFLDISKAYDGDNSAIDLLRKDIVKTLKELPGTYQNNKFCNILYSKHRYYQP